VNEGTKRSAIEHAEREYPREACGLIIVERGVETYVPCRNLATGTDHFALDPTSYDAAERRGEIVAVFHSHPNAAPTPSQADLVACEASGLPWHIVGVPSLLWAGIEPNGYIAPLVGRDWSHGVLDCYAIVRDYYKQERGIELMQFERHDDWWLRGENLYLDNFGKAGFKAVPESELDVGDVILMQMRSKVPNHAGIYIGGNIILHHLMNRLSSRDIYAEFYRRSTTHVLRYHGT
jgi:proteasome lid subunit RPN8/RPN11